MEICCEIDKMVRRPEFRTRYDEYEPAPEVVQALRAIEDEMTVVVVFGFWCPDSLRIVPEVLKAIREAGNPNLQVLAASVPLEETDELPVYVGPISVRRFPTVVFLPGHFRTNHEIPKGVTEKARFVEESLDAAKLRF